MDAPVKYDDASWHYGGDFPKKVPLSNGALHIGVFLAWMLLNDYGSDQVKNEKSVWLDPIVKRNMTPGFWMTSRMGEKFVSSWLNDEGNQFARAYYPIRGNPAGADDYYADYTTVFGKGLEMYRAEDGWATYEKIEPMIALRHRNFLRARKPLWKRLFA